MNDHCQQNTLQWCQSCTCLVTRGADIGVGQLGLVFGLIFVQRILQNHNILQHSWIVPKIIISVKHGVKAPRAPLKSSLTNLPNVH